MSLLPSSTYQMLYPQHLWLVLGCCWDPPCNWVYNGRWRHPGWPLQLCSRCCCHHFPQLWECSSLEAKEVIIVIMLPYSIMESEIIKNAAVTLMYRVMQKNSCMFESSRPLSAQWARQPMHSPSALTEHLSPNLARVFFARPCIAQFLHKWR